jgi:hypothetical protein
VNLPIPHDHDGASTGPAEIPADFPLLAEITAHFDTAHMTLHLRLYGSANPGSDAVAYTRAEMFDEEFLIEHHTRSYQGEEILRLAKIWLRLPDELRDTKGVSRVFARIYPTRPGA